MKDPLGRFYTESLLSSLLIDKLTSIRPSTILDIGFGLGSLTEAVYQRWGEATYYAVDLDQSAYEKSIKNKIGIKFYKADVLSENIQSLLDRRYGSFDLAVCNPPYVKLKKKEDYIYLLRQANLNHSINLLYYTSDLIFLAYNLLFLRTGGELGIILPDGLLTSHDFKQFRQDLTANYTIKSVIQLPDQIFKKTEARTHIIVLLKQKSNNNETNLYLVDIDGHQVDHITVRQSELVQRMDFGYQRWQLSNLNSPTTLMDLGADIKRGTYTQKELQDNSLISFHTTDFKNRQLLYFDNNHYINTDKIVAERGDILIARVGKRCIGKVALVESGRILLSDCVYRVRLSSHCIDRAWAALRSENGREWFSVFAHGVCSQVISKKDLLNFPIPYQHT